MIILQIVVFFLLFLLQFVYFPLGISFFEVPKVYGAEVGIFGLFLICLLMGNLWEWKKRKLLLLIIGLLVVLSLIHLFWGIKPNTFWGNPFRMQGTLLLWFLLGFLWISSSVRVKRFPFFWVLGAFLGQVILAFWVNSGSLGRAVGSLGEPNSLAGEMVFLWPFLLFTQDKRIQHKLWRGIVAVGSVVLVAVVIFVSGSRSGLVGFLLQLVLLGLVYICRFSLKWSVLACLFLLVLSYSLPFLDQNNLYENRGEIWQAAVFAGFRHPFEGNGFGNVEYVLHESNVHLGNHLVGYYVDSSHNVFLDWWVAGGIFGLGLFCFLLGRAVFQFVRGRAIFNLLLLFGLLGVLSFNPVSVVLLVAFWWVVGQGWNAANRK